jgi:hypothetical protein
MSSYVRSTPRKSIQYRLYMNLLCGPKAYLDDVANTETGPSWKWRHGHPASSQ